ncbi:hypothetical protein SAMN05880501_108131 [Ureibacillus xyleni]|uniref:Uncharacterized protein n=1 Tax=Ureibacillus xyleni TaxID=614648 RepID=A0A285T422_9BACL|nr:hypothetical protein [Ureibacillus xyleni]SOC15709.1 hypothetical protein SAMN05880501_108131 [Ureibacillus xyleni]
MGTGTNATCMHCDHQFHFFKGRGKSSFVHFCDGCGKSRRYAYSQKANADYLLILAQRNEGNGRVLSREEKLSIVKSASEARKHEFKQFDFQCDCGGTFTSDAQPKCPACGSEKLETSALLLWD